LKKYLNIIIINNFYTLACHKNDEPAKEKHIRTAICQTHEAQSSILFWKLAAKLPLAVNAVTCWKFTYLVHKILRDGHVSIMKDSRAYVARLEELARYWGHIQGKRVDCSSFYCTYVILKKNEKHVCL
jgi:huntingtin interacting protein 1